MWILFFYQLYTYYRMVACGLTAPCSIAEYVDLKRPLWNRLRRIYYSVRFTCSGKVDESA
ncbi:hypothetical protein SRDD_29850 [Serratia sp. DD3]|nr:hypothetical protein SRDD_29850 [Serratia sp. DD3]